MFSQVLSGPNSEFIGAAPANLDRPLEYRFIHEAACFACFLQKLGYFGQISMDALVTRDDYCKPEIHWVDSNARWGGVSIPLGLVNRLMGDWKPMLYRIAQRHMAALDDQPVLLPDLDPFLFEPDKGTGGIILLAPPPPNSSVLVYVVLAMDDKAGQALCKKLERILPTAP